MATIKHLSSKNSDLGAAERYLIFQHDESSNKPILDADGHLIPREDYRIDSVLCGDEDFAIACMKTNLAYNKNLSRGDVKTHHYIISFDPRDAEENGLTMDRAQELGLEFCKRHFPGHQALVCTHPDGHNKSGNIHVHSRKVKAALRAKHAAGERTATYAPLGYKKDPDAKNRIVIDEETRWVVEKIFDLAAHGCGAAKIARVLYDEKVPTPAYWHYMRQGKFDYVFADAPEDKAYSWSLAIIRAILNDETYIGNTIHHKQSTISYKNKKVVQNPKEEWVRVENTHEPIISKDLFDQVQEQIATRRRMQKDATTQIFAGLLKCADCGWSLTFARNANAKNPFGYYVCGRHRAYRYKGGECTRHYLRYDVLYAYVLERIQHWAKRAKTDENRLLEDLLKSGDRERAAAVKKQTAELKKAEKRKAELDNMFAKMYEDWAAGCITESNFNMLSQRYQKEQEEQEQKIQDCKTKLAAGQQTVEDAQKWVELIKQIGVPKELTAELLNTLIEKIIVHEATEDDFGFRQQEIEIIFRFVGKID